MTSDVPLRLRSPRSRLHDCIWLARLADKVRLHAAGKLPDEYARFLGHRRGIDGRFLRHFGLSAGMTIGALSSLPDDVAVVEWFRRQPGVSDETIEAWNDLAPGIGSRDGNDAVELRWITRHFFQSTPEIMGVTSVFELIEMDECPD